MVSTQNETSAKVEGGRWKAAVSRPRPNIKAHSARSSLRLQPALGFTLTELLIVIAIIGTLMALLLVAVQGGLTSAKRAEIILEMQNMGGAIEDLKNEFGAYPPNGMNNGAALYVDIPPSDFARMFKKAFPRHREPPQLIEALAAFATGWNGGAANVELPQTETGDTLGGGLTGAEAVVFWLGGFSQDTAYPISGIGGPSFADGEDSGTNLTATDEVLEDRNMRYEFDLTRLGPRTADGLFDGSVGRHIEYDDPRNSSVRRRINLWVYTPGDSRIPIQYFDTSRHDPEEYDIDMTGFAREGIYAIKQLREGVTQAQSNSDIRWAEDGTFQLLHSGTDDIWGDAFASLRLNVVDNGANAYQNILLAPDGPFIGDIADTLGHFMPGTLEDKQE